MSCHALQIINFFAAGWKRAYRDGSNFIHGILNTFNLIFCEMLHDNPEWRSSLLIETG